MSFHVDVGVRTEFTWFDSKYIAVPAGKVACFFWQFKIANYIKVIFDYVQHLTAFSYSI